MENGRSRYNGGGGDRGHSSASEQHPPPPQQPPPFPSTSEDLHAWSIYRQNLNSDFTDSALGSSEKSPMPYGNFHLRETTMQSILNNPKYGPKSELGTNMYTYLKFGLPRVLPPNGGKEGDRLSASRAHDLHEAGTRSHHGGERGHLHHHHGQNSSGYDSTDEELMQRHGARSAPFHGGGAGGALRAARSEDFLSASVSNHHGGHRRSQRALNEAGGHHSIQKDSRRSAAAAAASRDAEFAVWQQQRDRERKLKSVSEANLLEHHGQFLDDHDLDGGRVGNGRMYRSSKVFRSNGHLQHAASSHDLLQTGAFVNRAMEDDEDLDDGEDMDEEDHGRRSQAAGRMAKAASQISVVSRHSRNLQLNGGVSYRHEAPMLNDKYFPRDYLGSSNYLGNGLGNGMANGTGGGGGGNHEYDGFKYPHLQLRNVSFDTKAGKKSERILDSITMEARGGELVAILATKRKYNSEECVLL